MPAPQACKDRWVVGPLDKQVPPVQVTVLKAQCLFCHSQCDDSLQQMVKSPTMLMAKSFVMHRPNQTISRVCQHMQGFFTFTGSQTRGMPGVFAFHMPEQHFGSPLAGHDLLRSIHTICLNAKRVACPGGFDSFELVELPAQNMVSWKAFGLSVSSVWPSITERSSRWARQSCQTISSSSRSGLALADA